MSAFVYGRFESKREASTANTSQTDQPPALKPYADAFIALVPGDVLAAALVFSKSFTETKTGPDGKDVVTVTEPSSLKWSFYGCIVLAVFLYIAGHIRGGKDTKRWDKWDYLRMLIPAGAFVGWTMAVEPSTMFDSAINLGHGTKVLIVVFGAIVLGLLASGLGVKADQHQDPPANNGAPAAE